MEGNCSWCGPHQRGGGGLVQVNAFASGVDTWSGNFEHNSSNRVSICKVSFVKLDKNNNLQ